ncbi:MAG: matrixin family metalloprotease [Polyangia bacterium]
MSIAGRKISTIGAAVLSAAILFAESAAAFTVCEARDGRNAHWKRDEVRVVLDYTLTRIGEMDRVEQVLTEAFETWIVEAELPLDFTLVRGSCLAGGSDAHGERTNCITARSAGVEPDQDVGATAFVSYVYETGEIVDGDIVLFAKQGEWDLGDGDGEIVLRDVALHEVGHLLGLRHSEIEAARMYPLLETGSSDAESALHADDLAGAELLYGSATSELESAGCGWRCAIADGSPEGAAEGTVPFVALAALLLLASRARRCK